MPAGNLLDAEVRFDLKTNDKDRHAGGILFVDYARSAFDRDGRIVWTLPSIPGIVDSVTQVRDLKMTVDHTITFLTPQNAVEIDLDANVLWKAPNPFTLKNELITYHHDLKKTRRGTYIVLGKRKVTRRLPGKYTAKDLDKEYEAEMIKGKAYRKTQMDVVLEFDKAGNLIWFWDANDYITDEDLAFKRDPSDSSHLFSTHANAFSEDAEGKTIYLGFRDLSRIVKIDKKKKKVLKSYGEKFPSGEAKVANHLFRRQHDATITGRNSILILNNNEASDANVKRVSGIVEFSENITKTDSMPLRSFELDYGGNRDAWSSGGGNVTELPNGNILVCGGILNRLIEVNKNNEVVWEAHVVSRFKKDKRWSPFPQYRASWVPEIGTHHFIARLEKTETDDEVNLVITNTGSAEDFYTIEVLKADKTVLKITSSAIKIRETNTQKIKSKDLLPGSGASILKIKSEKGGIIKLLPLTP